MSDTPHYGDLIEYNGPDTKTARGMEVHPGSLWYVVGYIDGDGFALRHVRRGIDNPAEWEDDLISDMDVPDNLIHYFHPAS